MMVPDGASSSNANQVEAQQAEVVGQPSTMVKVAVPTGATPGQQINFTLPNGQRVTTSVQEGVQPGTVLTVAVPSMPERVAAAPAAFSTDDHLAQAREALLPRPTVVNAVEADQRCATLGWIVYGLSFLVCCLCSFPVALCIWGIVALDYFCKPYEERQRRPRSYAPACASLVTASTLCGLCLCLALLAMMGMAFVAMFCATDTNKTEMCTDLQKILNHTDVPWQHHHGPWHHPNRRFLDRVLHRDRHNEGPHFTFEDTDDKLGPTPGPSFEVDAVQSVQDLAAVMDQTHPPPGAVF